MPISGNRQFMGGGSGTRGVKFQPSASTVLWLPGQDDNPSATIRDRSGKNNTGTITGATWARLPRGLWSLSFDATEDYISVADSANLDITDNITIKLWFKYDTVAGGAYRALLAKGDGATPAWNYQILKDTDDDVGFSFYASADHRNVYDNVTTYAINTWYHWVVTFARPNVIIYVNGASAKTGSLDFDMVANSDVLIIGARYWGGDYLTDFDGDIALPVISSRNPVWTASEIANNFRLERHLFGI